MERNLKMKIKRKLFNYMQFFSKKYSAQIYYKLLGKKKLNLSNPVTFDDKIQWLKLYHQIPIIVQCADKYSVRKYVSDKDLSENLTKIYGVYKKVSEIDIDSLPSQFAMKVTSGCKMNIIVKEKNEFDWDTSKKQLTKWLKEDFGKESIEPHYSQIEPKIIVEEYLSNKQGRFPDDYKFFCFNGKPKFVEVMTDRTEDNQITRHFYDLNWNRKDWTKERISRQLECPATFTKMIEIAKVLCKDFTFVRVDLYDVDGRIVFGELTFTPSSGIATYLTEKAQREIGDMLELPKEKKIGFK